MTALAGSRVLVTGGAGFIGSHLVDTVLARGAEHVTVLDNLENGKRSNLAHLEADARFALVVGDIRDDLARARSLAEVDIVFHLACLGVRHSLIDPVENHDVNATGTLQMLLHAQRAGVRRFVYASTSEVFGTAQYAPMNERHPTWPETVYGAGKLAGEASTRAFFRTYGMDTVVVRPFNTYGPRSHFEGDSGEVLPRTIVRVLAGQNPIIFGDGEQTRDFMHVSDTARALAMIGESSSTTGQTINLGSGREISITELCHTVAQAAGRPDLVPHYRDPRPGDVRRLIGDAGHVRHLVGFEASVAFGDGVRELVDWFRTRPVEEMIAQVAEVNWVRNEVSVP
ncbi:GDP-mannose 4,6-dehydratase [Cryobacterium sp. BB307]|uniref:GDP-mannose 4,6-dehydratase n=1 Tax=Cryobacterium sp. BB307 TaxID=2716317 RepID=UPI0014455B7B|nr:GDP-mannose 4,6-dehydratase [Cryobacterium sp. BB307]